MGFQKLGTLTHLESLSLTGFAKVSDDGIAGQLMSTKVGLGQARGIVVPSCRARPLVPSPGLD